MLKFETNQIPSNYKDSGQVLLLDHYAEITKKEDRKQYE